MVYAYMLKKEAVTRFCKYEPGGSLGLDPLRNSQTVGNELETLVQIRQSKILFESAVELGKHNPNQLYSQ